MERTTLRELWSKAFGDDGWIDSFLRTAYRQENTLTLTRQSQIAAGLSWMEVGCQNRKLAYLYAVATDPAFRHQGLCRELMGKTHELLAAHGYAGSVLVPGDADLRQMYAKMGYQNFGGLSLLTVRAAEPVDIRKISPAEFAALRRQFLPEGGILQEHRAIEYLAESAVLYAGQDFLLAAQNEDGFFGLELLGNSSRAAGILGALGEKEGTFRIPGKTPFAMYRPLTQDGWMPDYFGLAFE